LFVPLSWTLRKAVANIVSGRTADLKARRVKSMIVFRFSAASTVLSRRSSIVVSGVSNAARPKATTNARCRRRTWQ
jgi:hypothetical protein